MNCLENPRAASALFPQALHFMHHVEFGIKGESLQ